MDTTAKKIQNIVNSMKTWYDKGNVLIENKNAIREATKKENNKYNKLLNSSSNNSLKEFMDKGFFVNDQTGALMKKYTQELYINLSEGIYLLDKLRELISGETIIYVATEQDTNNKNDIEKLFNDFREQMSVSTGEILFKGENLKKTETNFDNIKKKIDEQKGSIEELNKLNEHRENIVNKLKNYDDILNESPNSKDKFFTYYEKGDKTANDKSFIDSIYKLRVSQHRAQPQMVYNTYKDRFAQWAFYGVNKGNDIITMIKQNQYKGVNLKDFSAELDYTFYTRRGFSMNVNKGHIFEAYLRGADEQRRDIDSLMEESKGNTPYFQGPDLRLTSLDLAIQAKAADASVKGSTTYNQIKNIVESWDKLKTEDDYTRFFLYNFFEFDGNTGTGKTYEQLKKHTRKYAINKIDEYISKKFLKNIKQVSSELAKNKS